MPKHRHANIQSRARAVFTFALPTILALATLATTVAWAAPASGTPGGTDTPRLTATLATADGGQEACGDGDVHLVCTIAHEGLEPNARHRATVTLSDTEAHKPIEDEDGKAVEATHTSTPDQKNGTIEVEATVDGKRHLGRTIGATVAIRSGDRTIATREVSGDPVRIPKITARAVDATTGTRVAAPGDIVEFADEVAYECLKPGATYVLHGTVRDAETGAMLMGEDRRSLDGTEATREFTPTEAGGTVIMTYRFDTAGLAGRSVAVTEELRRADGGPTLATYDGIASHNEVRFPSLSSVAVVAREGTTIRDVLSYANLTPGLEYVATQTMGNHRVQVWPQKRRATQPRRDCR